MRLGCIALFLAVAALATGSADARTIRAHWTDTQPWGGGRIVYRTTKIWVHRDHFSITVEVTNRSKYAIRFFPGHAFDPVYRAPPGFGIAWRPPETKGTMEGRAFHAVGTGGTMPSEPISVGKTWTATFSGRSPLLRTHRTWWVTFGVVSAWAHGHVPSHTDGPHGTYWISGKTFRT